MKYRFIITIRKQNGETYTCERLANDEEQAFRMVKVPEGEEIVDINIIWSQPLY